METAVDVGEVGDRQFLNLATVGLTSLIARQLNVKMKRRFGVLSYAIALFVALRKERPFRARIETESGVEEYDTLQVVIGNGRFHGGPFPLAPDAGIDTGRLVVYSLATRSKGAFLRLALALPTGRHVDLPDVKWQTCRGGRLSTTPSMKVDVDGELCMNTPVEFRELPGALRVIAPLDFTRTD
jgi:diacylglycerol kinase family enzyme